MEEADGGANRRPLKSRGTAWAQTAARLLLASRVTPDQISIAGIAISAVGGWAVLAAGDCPWLFLLAAACIQLRLLCNMLDGMVAIEGGRKSAYGPLFNELPDRVEDSIFLVCFGYAAGLPWLGWLAALLAAVTAYVRTLGGVFGFDQDFRGPMAKPHRMAALTLAALLALAEALSAGTNRALPVLLTVIAAGTLMTIARRTLGVARNLRGRA